MNCTLFRRATEVVTLVALTLVPLLGFSTAHADEPVASWALSPAGSADGMRPSDRPELSYSSALGTEIDDAVTLYNLGTVQLTFNVYATDAAMDDSGQFQLLAGGVTPTGVGSWVSLAQELITVPPGTQATIPFTLKVPANAAPGDYAGGIVASVSSAGAGEQGKAITVERRTGTRLYVRVGGDFRPNMAVVGVNTDVDQSVNPFGNSARVTFSVENRGNTRLSGVPVVTVSGPFGFGSKTVTLDAMPEVLPGGRLTMSAVVEGVPALMKLNTEVRIIPAGVGGEGKLAEIAGTDSTFAPPVMLLVLMLAVILGVLALRAWRRRSVALRLVPA